MTIEQELRARAKDLKVDDACWAGIEVAVEYAQKMGFALDNLIDRVKDEWDRQEDEGAPE